jgi:putative hemolysin
VLDDPLILRLILLGVLLLLSAFFSGSETAFFSLNSLEKDALKKRCHGRAGRFVGTLFTKPDEVLVTILTGNMFVNIFASSIFEAVGEELFAQAAEVLSIAAMTVILLLIGEMTPKNLAIRHSLKMSVFSARIFGYLHFGLRPLVAPLSWIRHAVLSLYPASGRRTEQIRNDAVLSAIRMGYQSNTIQESELRLLERFFRFREKTAADVMVPRVDCKPVDVSMTAGALLESIAEGQVDASASHVPLFRNDVDHITGYVRKSDLVLCRLQDDRDRRLSELSRQIHAVPSSKALGELMEELRESGSEIAVVVDEYGGTEGLISYNSVIDYLFGDFAPEHEQPIVAIDDTSFRISGSTDLRDVEELLQITLESENRTLGGFIIDSAGELPREGHAVHVAGHSFVVQSVVGHRVAWVTVTKEEG